MKSKLGGVAIAVVSLRAREAKSARGDSMAANIARPLEAFFHG